MCSHSQAEEAEKGLFQQYPLYIENTYRTAITGLMQVARVIYDTYRMYSRTKGAYR